MSIEVKEGDKWVIEVRRTGIPTPLRQKDNNGTIEIVDINNQDQFRLNLDTIEDISIVCHY